MEYLVNGNLMTRRDLEDLVEKEVAKRLAKGDTSIVFGNPALYLYNARKRAAHTARDIGYTVVTIR